MKTLLQHIKERLIINKDLKIVDDFYFDDAKELYLVRFDIISKSLNCIQIDVINVREIVMHENNIYNVSGQFMLSQAHYYDCEFDADVTNGILLFSSKYNNGDDVHFDVLLHPSLKENFKKLVQNCFDDPDERYFPDEVFKILNIKCPKIPEKYNIEFDGINQAYIPEDMRKLAKHFNIS